GSPVRCGTRTGRRSRRSAPRAGGSSVPRRSPPSGRGTPEDLTGFRGAGPRAGVLSGRSVGPGGSGSLVADQAAPQGGEVGAHDVQVVGARVRLPLERVEPVGGHTEIVHEGLGDLGA